MTRFLVDASLPRPTAEVVRACGHLATDVRDIGLGSAPDRVIAAHARSEGFCLITRDWDFGNVRDYLPQEFPGIVVIGAPQHAGRAVVLDMVREFLRFAGDEAQLSGKLVIVEPGRVRVRA